ncbi:hypothetical protein [Micromonospora sp. NPDC007220]|uniref:hypothetical protein n=1 Tax=Micromonospora sp. NPDC007220 TaxID=3154318 RepID=UPI0034049AED
MAWENVATLGIALAAFVVSVVSAVQSKRSADASKRSADAAERQAAAAEAALPPPPPPVAWKVVHYRGEESFLLRNVGSEPALDVEVHTDGGRLRPTDDGKLKASELKPGGVIPFWMVTADQLPDIHEIKVRWRGSGDWVALPLP